MKCPKFPNDLKKLHPLATFVVHMGGVEVPKRDDDFHVQALDAGTSWGGGRGKPSKQNCRVWQKNKNIHLHNPTIRT